jgi:acetyl-CoA carboxylase carboxyltransferase component
MCSKDLGADVVLAWPSAEIAVMGPQGAANIIFRNEIEGSDNPVETRARVIQEYTDEFATPYKAAERGFVDDVIEPLATRARLIDAFDMLSSKREIRPNKKHGNIPL